MHSGRSVLINSAATSRPPLLPTRFNQDRTIETERYIRESFQDVLVNPRSFLIESRYESKDLELNYQYTIIIIMHSQKSACLLAYFPVYNRILKLIECSTFFFNSKKKFLEIFFSPKVRVQFGQWKDWDKYARGSFFIDTPTQSYMRRKRRNRSYRKRLA